MTALTTREKIKRVIEEMWLAGSIMTISGVAKEAGVSNSTIHNRYQDQAERIRELAGKRAQQDAREELEKQRDNIKTAKTKAAVLREEISLLKSLMSKVDSVNLALRVENEILQTNYAEIRKKYEKAIDLNREYMNEQNRTNNL